MALLRPELGSRAGRSAPSPAPVSGLVAGQIDWDVVDEELYHIPAEYKDQRFDSLKHVLTVLGAVDSEGALEELREQRETIEGLVDDVVECYHNGFAKAIHNYSQILQLFSDSKAQVETVKQNLGDTKRRLGTQSHHLLQQWRRSVTLVDINRLLEDVQTLNDMPPRLQKLEDAKDWSAAVNLLIDGCNRLARQELAQVGALRELRKDMFVRRNVLLKAIVDEVEERVYHSSIGEDAAEKGEVEDEIPELQVHALIAHEATLVMEEVPPLPGTELSPARARQSMVLEARRSMLLESRSKSSKLAPDSRRSMVVGRKHQHQRSLSNLGGNATAARAGLPGRSPDRRGSMVIGRRASSMQPGRLPIAAIGGPPPSSTVKPSNGADGGSHGQSLASLVDAVVQLAGASEALQSLRKHLATQIRSVLVSALEASVRGSGADEERDGAAPESRPLPPAQRILHSVFAECLRVLGNFITVMRLFSTVRPPQSAAVLELRRQQQGAKGMELQLRRDQAKHECELVWEAMQAELQRLLAEVLDAPSLTAGHGPGSSSAVNWSPGNGGVMAPRDAGKLSFSFAVEAGASNPALALLRAQSLRSFDAQDLGGALKTALKGEPPGTHHMPAMYKAVVRFTDDACQLLDRMWDADLGVPRRVRPLLDEGSSARQLRTFVDTFVTEDFLPDIYVDFRGQCTKMLEDPEAFKARARLQAAYDPDLAHGRPVVPAGVAADVMMGSLMEWSADMPPFAAHFVGVVESVLARVMDAFQVRMQGALMAASVKALSESPSLARLMAAEPAAPQAGSPIAFFTGRHSDSVDAFVTDVINNTGFGNGDEAAEAALLARLVQERPVRSEQLLSHSGDGQRLVQLAALSDSLDYIADAIARSGEQRTAGDDLEEPDSARSGSHGHGGSRLTEGLAHMLDRARAQAGQCVRALRLEMLLLMIYHLQDLARSSYECDEEDANEVDECIGAFSRAAARADEELSPYLPPSKRLYVFGALAPQAARFVMWLLPELKDINAAGVARMTRMLSVLQPALSTLGTTGGNFRPEASRSFERARTYFTLLTYSADSLVKVAADRPGRFTPTEYLALLQVNVPDRVVTADHRSQLQRIVSTGAQKPAGRLKS